MLAKNIKHTWRSVIHYLSSTHTSAEIVCKVCGTLASEAHQFGTESSIWKCPGVFSCCGGKSPGARWDAPNLRWVCKDCGTPQKKDDDIFAYAPMTANGVYNRPDKPGCSHEWAEYIGLNHTDTYCKKCNLVKK